MPAVSLNLQTASHDSAKNPVIQDVLPGEVPGLGSTTISLAPGVAHSEPGSDAEDHVFLILSGSGKITAHGREYPVTRETIAHFPVGWQVDVKADGPQGLGLLLLRLTLTPEDREDLAAHTDLNRQVYLKTFKECTPYSEAIKSAKTVSRTLLPKDIVPRMAIGTVEATGPDKVGLHRHPMLEQYFLGLEGNDITVITDDARTPLKADQLFHIPLGSLHGAEVADGCKLHYLWLDFFRDRQGQEWLKQHTPLTSPKK